MAGTPNRHQQKQLQSAVAAKKQPESPQIPTQSEPFKEAFRLPDLRKTAAAVSKQHRIRPPAAAHPSVQKASHSNGRRLYFQAENRSRACCGCSLSCGSAPSAAACRKWFEKIDFSFQKKAFTMRAAKKPPVPPYL